MRELSGWDKYFFEVCDVVSKNSKCLSRKVGSIITRDNVIICTGYNGPPRGVSHCDQRYFYDKEIKSLLDDRGIRVSREILGVCPRRTLGFKSGEGLQYCIAAHAERNCIVSAANLGVSTKGCVLYLNFGIPCKDCLIEIINAGIVGVVVDKMEFYDSISKYLLEESGLKIREYGKEWNEGGVT